MFVTDVHIHTHIHTNASARTQEGCLRMGKTLTDQEVDAWINEADVDGSGSIDLEVCLVCVCV